MRGVAFLLGIVAVLLSLFLLIGAASTLVSYNKVLQQAMENIKSGYVAPLSVSEALLWMVPWSLVFVGLWLVNAKQHRVAQSPRFPTPVLLLLAALYVVAYPLFRFIGDWGVPVRLFGALCLFYAVIRLIPRKAEPPTTVWITLWLAVLVSVLLESLTACFSSGYFVAFTARPMIGGALVLSALRVAFQGIFAGIAGVLCLLVALGGRSHPDDTSGGS